VRNAAATALGLLGDRDGAPALFAALQDDIEEVRLAAIIALGLIGPTGDVHETIYKLAEVPDRYDPNFRHRSGMSLPAAQLILLCHSADGFNRAGFCFR
jgi:HEAT repeat protein